MSALPEKLIIDKSVFQSTATERLKGFARNHYLILPDHLYYECVTATRQSELLLDRFRDVVLSGAYVSRNVKDVIRAEAKDLCPCENLVEPSEVEAVRRTFQQNPRPFDQQHADQKHREELRMAKRFCEMINGFNAELASEDPDILDAVRKWGSSDEARPERLVMWVRRVDENDVHEAAVKFFSSLTDYPERFCCSRDWFTWQYLRVWFIVSYEKCFLRHVGAEPSQENMEHDLQDVKYVSLLCRADGLLTQDRRCCDLAKAALPDKDIFVSIDEVPSSYVCNCS